MPSEPVKAYPRVGDRVHYEGVSDFGIVLAVDDTGGLVVEWQHRRNRSVSIVYAQEAEKLIVIPPDKRLSEASLDDLIKEIERRGHITSIVIQSNLASPEKEEKEG